jgi:hypothetical protein
MEYVTISGKSRPEIAFQEHVGKKRKGYEQRDIVRGATASSTKSANYKQITNLSTADSECRKSTIPNLAALPINEGGRFALIILGSGQ